MLISFIIPVYNSSKYIKDCVYSITNQTYKNIEVLLIDDGSTDNSLQICKELQSVDKRIKVIHKKNGGTSSARNVGLKETKGEYVTFIDNDDFWNNDKVLEEIVSQLEDSHADVLTFDTSEYYENQDKYIYSTKICKRSEIVGKSKSDALKTLISRGLLYRAVWTKVIKTSIIKTNKLFFPEGMRNEDTDWTADLLLVAKTYDYYEKKFHIYRKGHELAQTSKPISKSIFDDLTNILIKHFKKSEKIDDNNFKEVYLSFLAYPFSVWMGQSMFFYKENPNIINNMKKYSYILNYDLDKNVKKVKIVNKIFGFKNTCRLLNYYLKRKYKY